MRKIGIVIDMEKDLYDYLIQNLNEVFEGRFQFHCFFLVDMKPLDEMDVVLVMIKKRIINILPFISDTSKIIQVNRTITRAHYDLIKSIDHTNDILIINDNVDTTMDLVVTFYKLDINDKNFIPYNPNFEYEDIKYCITAKESYLIPDGLNYLDLGYRPIDISTIIEILGHMNIPVVDFQGSFATYQKKYMSLYKKSGKRLEIIREVDKLNRALIKDSEERGFVTKHTFESILTTSEKMLFKIKKAKKLAKHEINVLICGESGTGKELFAQAIHCESPRRNSPFIGVNVTAIPANLLESELFGYIEGAFTGAKKSGHKGLFEQTSGGTIFLDEIGDMQLEMQGKLLRVLEERCIRPIGGSKLINIDVRVIAATNKNLLVEIEKGNFREDLYYRLKSSIINIPPLRERIGDIIMLANQFLPAQMTLSKDVIQVFNNYHWRGNIRELKAACNYMEIMAEGQQVQVCDIPEDIVSVETDMTTCFMTHQIKQPVYANGEKIKNILNSILKLTSESSSAGRSSILKALNEQEIHIGEGELKRILVELREHGYIIQFKGRKGSIVTELGESYLKNNT